MASTNTTLTRAVDIAPERAYETTYTAVVFHKAAPVLDDSYPTESARRDAVVEVLRANHAEVSTETVNEVLAPYGGASATEALRDVIWLYADSGVDVHLGEHLRDVGPAVLYTMFTDYGDGTTLAEHYGSRQERLAELRQRAANLSTGHGDGFFENADETTCKQTIENTIISTHGCLHLFDAQRQDVGGAYVTYTLEA